MFTPLEFELKNEYQFKMIKDALSWWNDNFSLIIKEYTDADKNEVRSFRPLIIKLLAKMNKKANIPYELSIKNFKSEQSFVVAVSDYLKYNKEIRKPNNKEKFKAVYNVVAYAYKDLMVRKAIGSID